MKQLFQDLAKGHTRIETVPRPRAAAGQVLLETTRSLISAGTERMLVEFGRASLLKKARSQPERVRQVLDKIRSDGLAATVGAVRSRLDQPLPLGYCNVGVVAEIGAGVDGFALGDRVVSNGPHAEVACVPKNLCARIPDGVGDDAAAFTVLGAIGLQGVRLAQPTLGEAVVVTGLGLIGLLTVQILRAHGCRVLGIDPDPDRIALARRFGAEVVDLSSGQDPLIAADEFSRGRGVDAVLITASTRSNEPVRQAAKMCRKRGRIVLVGVAGLELDRADFYEKELTFQVSCSYGPGRYDPAYEERGQDYPIGFVRWTEQRNFEAVLDLIAAGAIDVEPLISHRFAFDDAGEAYRALLGKEPALGILLEYAPRPGGADRRLLLAAGAVAAGAGRVTVIGAGNHAARVLIPAFKRAGATLDTVVSAGGASATHQGRKHGFAAASTDADAAIGESEVDSIVVATRHESHAGYVLAALRAGKHVYCEKPLCLTLEELGEIEAELAVRPEQLLMVGFNRRFSPYVVRAKALLGAVGGPKTLVTTVNAGRLPADHWTRDPVAGGGRLVGEGCHFIDLMRHLAGAPIRSWHATRAGNDGATVTLDFGNGSTGTLHYVTGGHRAFPKERLEVFAAGRVLQLDNFRRLRAWGWPRASISGSWRQDKGHQGCVQAFVDAIRTGGSAPIPVNEILEVSRISIEAQAAL